MVSRTTSGKWTYALVVISPAMTARPVVTRVSHATRAAGSFSRRASSTASEMASATLSGCPSVTDSDVKRLRSNTAGSPLAVGEEERRPDTMLPGPQRRQATATTKESRSANGGQAVVEVRRITNGFTKPARQLVARLLGRSRPERGRSGELRLRERDPSHDALHPGHRSRRHAELPDAQSEQRERHQRL